MLPEPTAAGAWLIPVCDSVCVVLLCLAQAVGCSNFCRSEQWPLTALQLIGLVSPPQRLAGCRALHPAATQPGPHTPPVVPYTLSTARFITVLFSVVKSTLAATGKRTAVVCWKKWESVVLKYIFQKIRWLFILSSSTRTSFGTGFRVSCTIKSPALSFHTFSFYVLLFEYNLICISDRKRWFHNKQYKHCVV